MECLHGKGVQGVVIAYGSLPAMTHTVSTPVDQNVGRETAGAAPAAEADSRISAVRRSLPLPGFLRRERVLGQVIRFGLVGGLNTLVDYGLFNLLVVVFSMNPVAANPISVSAGIINSFLWNKQWTFAAGGWHRWYRQAILFLIVSVIGLLINTGGLWLLNRLTGADSVLAVNLQKLGASVLSLTWNFVGYRFLVFRKAREAS